MIYPPTTGTDATKLRGRVISLDIPNDLDVYAFDADLDLWVPVPPGTATNGLPPGGTTGQTAVKASDADFDVEWSDNTVYDPTNVAITGGTINGIDVGDIGAATGDVVGPASATDGAFPLYDGTTGKLIKGSAYTPASFQPVDSDLTAIAALSTTSFGRALLELADAEAMRTAAGLGTLATQSATITDYLLSATAASTYQPLDSDLTAIAALSTTSFGLALLELADAAALRTAGGLVIGTNVQAYSSNLAALATAMFFGSGPGSGTIPVSSLQYGSVDLHGVTIALGPFPTSGGTLPTALLNGITSTRGSILYAGILSSWNGLAPGTSGLPLKSNGTGADPSYGQIPIASAISGLGTNVATALAVAIGSAGAPVLFNGALGTPSSGTLTNCTFPTLNQNTSGTAANLSGTPALPNGTTATTQSAADNSTKLATTAYADAAVAAGGGDNFFWIGASDNIPRVTNGSLVNAGPESTTNKVNYDTVDFDPATSQYVQFWRCWPKGWNTVTAKFIWTADSGSGDVVWGAQIRCCVNDDPIDSAFGTAQTATDTLTASSDLDISPATSAITPAGTVSDGAPTIFQFYRDASAGGDTLGTNARLIGVLITKAS